MKQRKIFTVLAVIFVILGAFLVFIAIGEMDRNPWYDFEKPYYSDYEAAVVMTRNCGIFVIACGIVLNLLAIVSRVYESANLKDAKSSTENTKKCSHCHIRIDDSMLICPRCKEELKKNQEN